MSSKNLNQQNQTTLVFRETQHTPKANDLQLNKFSGHDMAITSEHIFRSNLVKKFSLEPPGIL